MCQDAAKLPNGVKAQGRGKPPKVSNDPTAVESVVSLGAILLGLGFRVQGKGFFGTDSIALCAECLGPVHCGRPGPFPCRDLENIDLGHPGASVNTGAGTCLAFGDAVVQGGQSPRAS